MLTIKQLSRIAGVTTRAIRYYDEKNLLKPDFRGRNGYRYYGEGSVLLLQQILLYRNLGLQLDEVRRIIQQPDFDIVGALEHHKQGIHRCIQKMENLYDTLETTINYLKGKESMTPSDFFKGFSDEQQDEFEQEAMRLYDPQIVKASSEKWNAYTKEEKQRIGEEGMAVYHDFLKAMPAGADSPLAQACVGRWHSHMRYFWTPDDDQLLAIASGYCSDVRFKSRFDEIEPNLAEFIRAAVGEYVAARKK